MKYLGRRITVFIYVLIVVAWHSFYFLADYESSYKFMIKEGHYVWDLVFIPLLSPFFWWMGKQYDIATYLSERDSLTGLLNRRFAEYYFTKYTILNPLRIFAVISIDINNFKQINDIYGHDQGDQILIKLSHILLSRFPRHSVVARWGGDEFVICIPLQHRSDSDGISDSLAVEMNQALHSCEKAEASVSVGFALFPTDSKDFEELIKLSDARMYQNKRMGRNMLMKM